MDEYNQGWDPEVRQYLKKVLNSFVIGAFWLLTIATLGLFMRMAYIIGDWHWHNTVFYSLFLISFVFLLRFFYRVWRRK
jgi:hypothetical protein